MGKKFYLQVRRAKCWVKKLFAKDYLNLLTVDFICHGVPSPLVWQQYVDTLKKKLNSKITEISFRDKKDGWKSFNFKLITANGDVFYEKHGDNTYMKGFLKDLYLRLRAMIASLKHYSVQVILL